MSFRLKIYFVGAINANFKATFTRQKINIILDTYLCITRSINVPDTLNDISSQMPAETLCH